MSGAACLAGLGALRGGAGLVYLAVPEVIQAIVASVEPSYLTVPLPDDTATGQLSDEALAILRQHMDGKDSIAVGPGLGTSAPVIRLVRSVYQSAPQAVVIDADGLNALAHDTDCLKQAAGPRILTPHPGEFARLTDVNIRTVKQHREELAAEFAAENRVVLVLKGHGSVTSDGDRVAVNTTGNSGMATGGSGDVLTGLIAALLAQGMSPFDAAQAGVYLHGLAGDLAVRELSQPALIASDLPLYLAKAWKEMETDS